MPKMRCSKESNLSLPRVTKTQQQKRWGSSFSPREEQVVQKGRRAQKAETERERQANGRIQNTSVQAGTALTSSRPRRKAPSRPTAQSSRESDLRGSASLTVEPLSVRVDQRCPRNGGSHLRTNKKPSEVACAHMRMKNSMATRNTHLRQRTRCWIHQALGQGVRPDVDVRVP